MPTTTIGLHDIVEAIPEEQLTRQDIRTRAQNLTNFRTPQCWGMLLSPFVYAYGSSALMNDDDQHRLLAIVTGQEGTLIGCHPLANIDGIADILGGFESVEPAAGVSALALCPNCDEQPRDDDETREGVEGFCASCIHDARRSGWEG